MTLDSNTIIPLFASSIQDELLLLRTVKSLVAMQVIFADDVVDLWLSWREGRCTSIFRQTSPIISPFFDAYQAPSDMSLVNLVGNVVSQCVLLLKVLSYLCVFLGPCNHTL